MIIQFKTRLLKLEAIELATMFLLNQSHTKLETIDSLGKVHKIVKCTIRKKNLCSQ